MIAGELGQLLDHHGPRRHVDADGQRLGGEHGAEQPGDEALLDGLLERRHHPGVVRRDAGVELGSELAVAEHGEIGLVETVEPLVDDLVDRLALGAVGQPHPGVDDVPGRLLALVAAEDEVDRRQQVAAPPAGRSSRTRPGV